MRVFDADSEIDVYHVVVEKNVTIHCKEQFTAKTAIFTLLSITTELETYSTSSKLLL